MHLRALSAQFSSMEQLRSRKVSQHANAFASLPEEVLALVIRHLDVKGLLAFAISGRRFSRAVVDNEQLWKELFTTRFGAPTKLHCAAHKIAGSWLKLYKAKIVTDKAADPWRKPSEFELRAALQDMTQSSSSIGNGSSIARTDSGSSSNANNNTSPAASLASSVSLDESDAALTPDEGVTVTSQEQDELCVVFLVDGSGSVGEEDFSCMTSFLETAAEAVAAVPQSKVSIVQFSNDTRVEVPLAPWDKTDFQNGIKNMVRMNGGTNIAAAVAKAGSLFKALPSCGPATRRVLVLLTDGRIDSYQAKEAGQMVAQLADEQAHVGLWAFGVGRGVDAPELMRIIEGPGAAAKGLGKERYVELCVRDDAPW